MKDSEIKSRLRSWKANSATKLVTKDPIRYQSEISLAMYGVTYVAGGIGETIAEARKNARQAIAAKAF